MSHQPIPKGVSRDTLLDVVRGWAAVGAASEPRYTSDVAEETGISDAVGRQTRFLESIGVLEAEGQRHRLTDAGADLAGALADGDEDRAADLAADLLEDWASTHRVRSLLRGNPTPREDLVRLVTALAGHDPDASRPRSGAGALLDLYDWAGVLERDDEDRFRLPETESATGPSTGPEGQPTVGLDDEAVAALVDALGALESELQGREDDLEATVREARDDLERAVAAAEADLATERLAPGGSTAAVEDHPGPGQPGGEPSGGVGDPTAEPSPAVPGDEGSEERAEPSPAIPEGGESEVDAEPSQAVPTDADGGSQDTSDGTEATETSAESAEEPAEEPTEESAEEPAEEPAEAPVDLADGTRPQEATGEKAETGGGAVDEDVDGGERAGDEEAETGDGVGDEVADAGDSGKEAPAAHGAETDGSGTPGRINLDVDGESTVELASLDEGFTIDLGGEEITVAADPGPTIHISAGDGGAEGEPAGTREGAGGDEESSGSGGEPLGREPASEAAVTPDESTTEGEGEPGPDGTDAVESEREGATAGAAPEDDADGGAGVDGGPGPVEGEGEEAAESGPEPAEGEGEEAAESGPEPAGGEGAEESETAESESPGEESGESEPSPETAAADGDDEAAPESPEGGGRVRPETASPGEDTLAVSLDLNLDADPSQVEALVRGIKQGLVEAD